MCMCDRCPWIGVKPVIYYTQAERLRHLHIMLNQAVTVFTSFEVWSQFHMLNPFYVIVVSPLEAAIPFLCFPLNKLKTERSWLPVCQRLFPEYTTLPNVWTCASVNSAQSSNLGFHKWFSSLWSCSEFVCVRVDQRLCKERQLNVSCATAAFCPAGALTCAFDCVCWILSILLFLLSVCAYVETMASIWPCMLLLFFFLNHKYWKQNFSGFKWDEQTCCKLWHF